MRDIAVSERYRDILNRIITFLEYLLIFVVIAECNSIYAFTDRTDVTTDMRSFFYTLGLGLPVMLLALQALADRQALKRLRAFVPVWLALVVYAGAFYVLNVRHVSGDRRADYIRNFMLLLPLLVLYFKLKQQKGEALDLLYKHADIVCVIAAMSLLVYLCSVFHVNTMPSDPIYITWTGGKGTQEHINLLNLCHLSMSHKWQMSNVELLRNMGFFVEPLMFAIPLITALHTELFLRKRADGGHLYRALLLSVVLVTANSTIGVMLTAIAWGAKSLSESVRRRKWWLVAVIIGGVIAACALLYLTKKSVRYEVTEVSGNSIGDHIEDFKAGFKAFLHRPLVGGGYNDEACIRAFMPLFKLEHNPGLSNSVATVLGEGGLMLGTLCLIPFLVCLLCLFRKDGQNPNMALWAIGPLGLFIGVIFVYHMFLIFIMAFGYSLIEVGGPRRLALADCRPDHDPLEGMTADTLGCRRRRTLGFAVAGALAGALFVWLGVPVCAGIYRFLRTHQFSISQSPLKAFCFTVVVLFHGVCLLRLARREVHWGRCLAVVAWDALYLWVYPAIYSNVATLLVAHHSTGGRLECAAMLGLYFLGSLLVLELTFSDRWSSIKSAVVACGLIAVTAGLVLLLQLGVGRLSRPGEALIAALDKLTETASGKVYAGELPALYHRVNPNIALSSTGASGHEDDAPVSVIYGVSENRWELFEHGFQMVELPEQHVLYTNDERVIEQLSVDGYSLYRYYPYSHTFDLGALAAANGLALNAGGELVIGGGQSLEAGFSDTLQNGRYTVGYELSIDPTQYRGSAQDAPVCSLVVSSGRGRKDLALKEVALDAFDAGGFARVELTFTLTSVTGGLEYEVIGQQDNAVMLRTVEVYQAPAFITTTGYNAYRRPIREAYYKVDGQPYIRALGYAGLHREYNVAGLVKSVRYLDSDMQPMMISRGYAEIHYGYNNKRTRDYEAYYDAEGAPTELSQGYAAVKTIFDAHGNAVNKRYYDRNGSPALLKAGYSEIYCEYDSRKCKLFEGFYDGGGKRTTCTDGYSAIRWEYNDNRQAVVKQYLDTEDRPVCASDGICETKYGYDAIGRVCEEYYYGADGQPTLNSSGYAAVARKLNEAGLKIQENYLDTEGNPVENTSGVAEIRRQYNAQNELVKVDYLDINGDSVGEKGYRSSLREYNDDHTLSRETYVDENGAPVVGLEGYVQRVFEYDDDRNRTAVVYLDMDGEPVENDQGIAMIRYEYKDGYAVRQTYYDASMEPVISAKGYAGFEREYDENGKIIRITYLNTEGQPMKNRSGVATIRREYDAAGNRVAEYYFDTEGQPTQSKKGVAEIHRTFDKDGNQLTEEKLDLKGNIL